MVGFTSKASTTHPRAWPQRQQPSRRPLAFVRTLTKNVLRPAVGDPARWRKEEALSKGRRAIELLPVEKDSADGSHRRSTV